MRPVIAAAGLFLGLNMLNVAARPTSAALVLEYRFDEGSGPTAHDSSGNNNDGNLASGGGVTFTATAAQGPFAIFLQATGNGASYVAPARNPLAGVSSFTIDVWVDPAANASDSRSIFSDTGGSGTGPGFNFYLNSSGTSDHALVFATNGALLKTGPIGNFGVYHNVAVTVANAASNPTVALYVDGQPAAASGSVAPITDLTTLPRLGIFADGTFSSNFFGNIDDYRVFNTALTPAEVAALVPEPRAPGLLALAGAGLLRRRRPRAKTAYSGNTHRFGLTYSY
jgi:hypothetical protein